MNKDWGEGMSGVGIAGRRVSDCGDVDPLKGLFIGVRLKPHVRNGK